VSSASVYQKPASGGIIDEKSAIGNPYWLYAADKIASEAILQAAARQTDFPLTIVRPSHTYGTGWLPSQYTSADFTIASRLLAGLPLAVPGDGQSLWTLTHVRDFAVGLLGLCGQAKAIGHTFNIAGDDVLTWDEIYRKLARALAVEARLVHIPSDFIARVDPALGQTLLGDKACSAVFDNSLLCSVVPDFATTIRLDQGLAEALAWRRAAPERTKIDGRMNARIETILERWAVAMQAAFPQG
jgi:nucleoside-diphosphate-sugar epimerase